MIRFEVAFAWPNWRSILQSASWVFQADRRRRRRDADRARDGFRGRFVRVGNRIRDVLEVVGAPLVVTHRDHLSVQ